MKETVSINYLINSEVSMDIHVVSNCMADIGD